MNVFAYGEDALTLWAIKTRLDGILKDIEDKTKPENCQVFFRPSFGRSGGTNSSQFGEFDFIILADEKLYLGESKWDRSSEHIDNNGNLQLRIEQSKRHEIFRTYIEEWICGCCSDWKDLINKQSKINKIAPLKSLLAENMETALRIIQFHYVNRAPVIKNLLLYLYNSTSNKINPPNNVCDIKGNIINFTVVPIDYSQALTPRFGNFIRI